MLSRKVVAGRLTRGEESLMMRILVAFCLSGIAMMGKDFARKRAKERREVLVYIGV